MRTRFFLFFGFCALLLGTLTFFQIWKNDPLAFEQPPESAPENPPAAKDLSPHPDTLLALSEKEFTGSDLRLVSTLETTDAYSRHAIRYRSEGFTVSGVLNLPHGTGPFPVLILNHGYVDPETYRTGEGLKREQDFFARNGYATLYSDYRNHAESDQDPKNEVRPRTGYVEDILNLLNALKASDLPSLNKERIGMLGFSLGGGVTLNIMVTKPESARAYALLAPIHSDYRVNFEKWVITEWPETALEFYRTYGTLEANPDFWYAISAKNFLSRITAPVILHQGTSDGEVPVAWSRELERLLTKEGKDITYFEYPAEPHIFREAGEALALERTLRFFDTHVKEKVVRPLEGN